MSQHKSTRRRLASRGLTLLEVMFSIGIVVIGLLGVLVLIPVAGHRATQGMIADGADRLGRNAIRQFDVEHMRQPNMWTLFSTTAAPQQYVSFLPTVNEPAFCIDPLFVSTQVLDAQTAGVAIDNRVEYFPHFATSGEARMRRISLRKFPGATNLTPPLPPQMGMTRPQALSVFMADDDLSFDLPEDRTLAPEQDFGDATARKRQFTGKFTWIATVTPKGLLYLSGAGNSAPLADQFTLSVIVFHRRDLIRMLPGDTQSRLQYSNPTIEGSDPERLVNVRFTDAAGALIPGAGIAGGNMRFETIARQPPPDPSGVQAASQYWQEDLDARTGSWVMLSAKVLPNANNNYAPVSVFRWYRVLSADEPQGDATNGFAMNVSLLGPDWTDVIQAGGATNTQATLLTGVVAVYEKTIRLETSGMWTDY